ncbi:HIT domain-containing protein [Candidatus Marsarchaeota archaeon]|nr:HIT domain-containing protein [Candidatus Marsarchaeota archaeon]MCL5404794.1 HIT domain-containing protein [Candidatus Marsarchaeota archaeon]
MQCVFCTLAAEHEKHLFDGRHCYAVLDINPASRGHMLVITDEHYETLLEVPDDVVAELFIVAKALGAKAVERLGASGLNIGTNIGRIAGQEIMHTHVHIIPRYTNSWPHGRKRLSDAEGGELFNLLKIDSI